MNPFLIEAHSEITGRCVLVVAGGSEGEGIVVGGEVRLEILSLTFQCVKMVG